MPIQHHVDDRRDGSNGDHDSIYADPHTQRIIDYLDRSTGPVHVTDLATQVVADLTNKSPEDVPANVRRRVQTWLHHGQLPALAERNIVKYDPDRGTVELA